MFIHFLNSLKTPANTALIETIQKGYAVVEAEKNNDPCNQPDKFDCPETFAVVSQNIDSNWVRFYEWAGSDTKKFTGHFLNVEDAIKAVPQTYRMIKVDITDNDGKPISYKINRDAPTIGHL